MIQDYTGHGKIVSRHFFQLKSMIFICCAISYRCRWYIRNYADLSYLQNLIEKKKSKTFFPQMREFETFVFI